METMRTKSMAPRPAARMAVISLSAARRDRPRRMPTRTAMGMVHDEGVGQGVGDDAGDVGVGG